jgi:hypothetical protein
MNLRNLVFGVFVLLFLTSCDIRDIAENFIPEPEAEFARQHFLLYRADDVDRIMSELIPALRNDETRAIIETMVDYIPNDEPIAAEVVGASTVSSSGSRLVTLSIQYEYEQRWLVFSVIVDASSSPFLVNAVNAELLEQSLEETNAFRLGQNGAVGILIVLLSIAMPLFCIYAFIVCLRTPIPKGKWRWAILCLLGAMTFQINWTTGETATIALHLQLLAAGIERAGFYGPWILSVSVPFGALVFFSKRGKWLSAANAELAPDNDSASDNESDNN